MRTPAAELASKAKKKRTWSMCLSSKPVRRAALWVFLHFEEPTPRLPTPPGFPPMDNKGLSEVLAKDNLFFWNQEKSCRKVKTLLSFFSTSSVFLLFFNSNLEFHFVPIAILIENRRSGRNHQW